MINLTLGLSAFLIAGLYAFGIMQIPLLGFGDPLGPRLLPSILAAALAVTGVFLLLEGRGLRTLRADAARLSGWFRGQDFRAAGSVVVWTGLYFAAFKPLGYLAATVFFLLGLILKAHPQGRIAGAVVALLFAPASYFLFTRLFNVPLPRGILPF